MKFWIYLVLLLFTSLSSTAPSLAEVGDVNYISDVLNVPLRSGPSNAHRILHRGLRSGTRLTLLATDEEAGFTQVRTDSGMEGWVRSQHLVRKPIARVQLATAQTRLQKVQSEIDQERKARATIQAEFKKAEANNRTLNSRAKALAKELDELKRISADAINQHARIVELTQQNERLHDEVGELSSTTQRLEANVQRDWLLFGGTLVLIGLFLGVMIKARPRQTSYSRFK